MLAKHFGQLRCRTSVSPNITRNASARVVKTMIMLPSTKTAVFSGQKNVASLELALIRRSPSGTSLISGLSECIIYRKQNYYMLVHSYFSQFHLYKSHFWIITSSEINCLNNKKATTHQDLRKQTDKNSTFSKAKSYLFVAITTESQQELYIFFICTVMYGWARNIIEGLRTLKTCSVSIM